MSAQLTYQVPQDTTTEPTGSAGHGRLGGAWQRIRTAVREMNYASRRAVEVQAPWIVDAHWHSR